MTTRPEFKPLHTDFGAEVGGLDLRDSVNPAAQLLLVQALREHSLLLFRAQPLVATDFPRIAATIGRNCSELKRYETPGPSPDQAWHCVGAIGGSPATATLLCSRVAPASGGGMAFVSTRALWQRLPQTRRQSLAALRGRHSFRAAPGHVESFPLLNSHGGGAPALFAGYHLRGFEDMADDQAGPLIAELMTEATRPGACCEIDLAAGDVLLWDNWSLMHRACAVTSGETRVIEEVSVYGDP
jgi:alpha-ketoglutarate-dependent taurine dioxygenase